MAHLRQIGGREMYDFSQERIQIGNGFVNYVTKLMLHFSARKWQNGITSASNTYSYDIYNLYSK